MHFSSLLYQQQWRWKKAIIFAFIALLIISLLALSAGEVWFSPFTENNFYQDILFSLRLPRLIAAILIGAALSVSGASLQVLLQNPLAEPGVLGISGGASLAVVIVLFFLPNFATTYTMMLAAMLGALLFTCLLVFLARIHALSMARLLLIGVALGILSSALITWAFYFSSDLNLRQLMYWLMGSLSGVGWQELSLALILVPSLIVLCLQGGKLDVLMLGDIQAKALGLDSEKNSRHLIILVSLLVAASVAMAGIIGFIGLIVPHFLRLAFGSENKYLLPLSAIVGAAILVLADLIGRLAIAQTELPVGAVTSTLGAPVFIWMLMRPHVNRF